MIEWSETDVMIRDAIRDFIDKEVRPNVDALESGELSPYPVIRRLFQSFGLDVLAKDGVTKQLERQRANEAARARGETVERPAKEGSGSPLGGQQSMGVIAISELCGVCMGLVTAMGVSLGLTAGTIMSRGTLAQKQRWVPELMTFEKVGAWAITEPDSGSDAFGGMKSYVTRDGEGYRLNGRKTFITNGPDADVLVVYAKLDEGDGVDRRERKVLAFVLEPGLEGFAQGKPFRKMGIHTSHTGELFFDNVYLGPERLLGETEEHGDGDGRDSARSNFTFERVGVATMALGIINECLRLSVDYAQTRVLWGQEIGHFQLVQLKLATMEIARINVQNMVFRNLEMAAAGKSPSLAEASAMKLYSSQAATDVAMEAVQLFGGNGYMADYRVEQLARDAKSLMIYAGSNEIQVTHIAKGLLSAKG
jgi:alkylation response protein AidB-like acyl-CoA dehydrogenase